MAPANTGSAETLIVGGVVMCLAGLFATRLWLERRVRDRAGLSEADARHFAGRDGRRRWVAAILTLIGLAMIASTWIDLDPEPVAARRAAARLWGWTWVCVLALTVALLILALVDWFAGAAYARRQVRSLAEEHRALLTEALRQSSSGARRPDPDTPSIPESGSGHNSSHH